MIFLKMAEPTDETGFQYFRAIVENGGITTIFNDIGKENENIKVIGLLLELTPVMKLEEDYSRTHSYEKDMRVNVLTESVLNKCYDWKLQRRIQKDTRISQLRYQLGMPIIVDVISGTEGITIEGTEMTKQDIINYLYGKYPRNPNFHITYISSNFLPSSLVPLSSPHVQDTKL